VAHGGLAAIYADQGELNRAEKEFREAMKLQPGQVAVRTELAYVLQREDKLAESQKLFEGVIKQYPNFYRAHEGLARVFEKQHHLKEAEKEAKTAVRLRKDEGTLEVLATIYSDEGDTARAKRFWMAVLKMNPKDKQALLHLGLRQQAAPPAKKSSTPAAPISAAGKAPESTATSRVSPSKDTTTAKSLVGPVEDTKADILIGIAFFSILACGLVACLAYAYQSQTDEEDYVNSIPHPRSS